jgi:hypothetical protein
MILDRPMGAELVADSADRFRTHRRARYRAARQPTVVVTEPSWRTMRAGKPASVSQAGARSLLMIAAVLAILAPAQVFAATLTVRQQELAGAPRRSAWRKSR